MRERGVADALLRERLPPRLRRRLAGPAELMAESFVGASMRGLMADVVLRAPLTGGEHAVVYCLVEHKRQEHPRALAQVLDYLNALNQHLVRTTPPGPLPLVVPMLIHNGAAPWSGPVRFSDLVAGAAWARPFMLDFEVILVDVAREPTHALSTHPKLKGALQGLRAASLSGRALVRTVERVLDVFVGDESTQQFFLRYLMDVVKRKDGEALRLAAARSRSSAMQTYAEFLKAQGRRTGRRQGRVEGRVEGREEGREEGRLEALRESVRRVLLKRFRRVTANVEARLAEADAATLERWFEAALEARSLRAVFTAHVVSHSCASR